MCELLCIIRVVVYKFYNQVGCILINRFSCICEAVIKELYEVRRVNFIKEYQISEFLKWFGRVGKYLHHHVAFAAIQTVSNMMMLLTVRA